MTRRSSGNSAYRRISQDHDRVMPSRSMPARSPRKPAMTGSSSCAPTPGISPLQAMLALPGPAHRRDAVSCRQGDASRHARSSIHPMPPSVAMSSAPSSPLMLHKELFDRCAEAGIKPGWRRSCVISTACRAANRERRTQHCHPYPGKRPGGTRVPRRRRRAAGRTSPKPKAA